MQTTTKLAIVGLVGLSLIATLGSAHTRNYLRTDAGVINCIDDRFTVLGTGGAVGGVLNTVGATIDPTAPDSAGTCYRANHIVPNVNGDVSFSWVDQVQSNVGGCVSQDSDGDGGLCDDEGDIQQRGCNGVTVNTNVPVPNAYRFQDGQGVPARQTWVAIVRFTLGTSLLGPIFPDCGEGVDSFGTTGNINHS